MMSDEGLYIAKPDDCGLYRHPLSEQAFGYSGEQFAEGAEKEFRLFTSPEGERLVVASYKKHITPHHLGAIVTQQRILHALMPDKFVVQIIDASVCPDGVARYMCNYVEIDDAVSMNTTGSGERNIWKVIKYIKDNRESSDFQTSIPVMERIGLLPKGSQIMDQNELAGATLYAPDGRPIVVDVMDVVVGHPPRYTLNIDEIVELAQQKGLAEDILPLVEEYKLHVAGLQHERGASDENS